MENVKNMERAKCPSFGGEGRILALDNVGLLPEHESLHRGWQEFSADFHIADVMRFSDFGRARRYALPCAAWKPLPVLMPKGSVR